MNSARTIQSVDQIKALADPQRLLILQRLLTGQATLSQLANQLKHSPAWVRHHLLGLEKAGLVELVEVRKTGRVIEKYYQAKAGAYLVQQWVLPASDKPFLIFSGSHDLALEWLAARTQRFLQMIILPVGSLNGLINLRQGVCQLSGTHILDPSTGEYNTPTLKRLFPDRSLQVITLAHRTQGLMIARKNPKGIHGINDLARADVRFVNRNEGSGTRLWLDTELGRLGISTAKVLGYEHQFNTHQQTARCVQKGEADVALGLQAAAFHFGLDFIPLYEERYDLVFYNQEMDKFSPLLVSLTSSEFRNQIQTLSGYNTTHSGEQILF